MISLLGVRHALMAMVVGLVSTTAEDRGARTEADPWVLVVSGIAGGSTDDSAIADAVTDRGYEVRIVTAEAFVASTSDGASAVVVSASAGAQSLAAVLRDLAVPVVTLQPALSEPLGLGDGRGRPEPASTIDVERSESDPLALAYEVGQVLRGGGFAPARRAVLVSTTGVSNPLTEVGHEVVAAAVDWAASSGAANPAPEVSAGPDLVVEGSTVRLDATVTDDGAVSSRWVQVAGPRPASIEDPTALSTTVTDLIAGTYQFAATATDGTTIVSDDVLVTNTTADRPTSFEVWTGDDLLVERAAWPQPFVNLIGVVRDADGVESLTYALDGAGAVDAGLGPNGRRLVLPGEFNIDLPLDRLSDGPHEVLLTAVDGAGAATQRVVEFTVVGGSALPNTMRTDFGNDGGTGRGVVVVDGRWRVGPGTLSTVGDGYDRLVAIGDLGWTDYDALVPIRVDALAATPARASGDPAVGVIANWTGHNDSVTPGSQPLQGFRALEGGLSPFGSILWWRAGRVEVLSPDLDVMDAGPSVGYPMGHWYLLRVQVDSAGSTVTYRARMWRSQVEEPQQWDVVWTSGPAAPAPTAGSLVLVAHEATVSFGDVTVRSLD